MEQRGREETPTTRAQIPGAPHFIACSVQVSMLETKVMLQHSFHKQPWFLSPGEECTRSLVGNFLDTIKICCQGWRVSSPLQVAPCQDPGCPKHPLLNPSQPHPGHSSTHLLQQLPLPPASQAWEGPPPGPRSFWSSCCQEGVWLRAEAKPSFMHLQLGQVPRVRLWFHKE